MHYVYMIKNQYNNLYIGITDNPMRRLNEHNTKRGARFTKAQDHFEIVFLEKHENISSARNREIQIKKWRRDKKDTLIALYRKNLQTFPHY